MARLEQRYGGGTRPGNGIRIAIIDTGVDIEHPEIAPAWRQGRLTYTRILGASREPSSDGSASHGTAVSSLILAHRDPLSTRESRSFHGIAYGANVDVYGIPLGGGATTYTPREATSSAMTGVSSARVALLNLTLGRNPSVVNMSFGYAGIVEQYTAQSANMATWLASFIAKVKSAPNTVFVAAAGNNNVLTCTDNTDSGCSTGTLEATSPSFDSALPVWDNTIGNWVAVVATDSSGAIAWFSNRCGLAAKWCIAAPGLNVEVANSELGGAVRNRKAGNGTSYAAPLVSGGLAVVKQYFGNTLTMQQVLSRVLDTATVTPDPVPGGSTCPAHLDTDGDPSDCELSSITGHGLMSLARATRPVGRTTGHGTIADPTGAIGRALSAHGATPVVFDSLGYPFRAAQVVSTPSGVDPVPSFLGEGSRNARPSWNGLQWQQASGPEGGTSPWAFAGSADKTGAVSTAGVSWQANAGAAEWQAGFITERDRIHGAPAHGTWAGDGFWHHTTFLEAAKQWQLSGDGVRGASLRVASTVAQAAMEGNGVLHESNGIYTGHSITLEARGAKRRTRFSLESPLRAEHGTAALRVPVGGTLEDGVRYADIHADLTPDAREVRLGAQHDVELPFGRIAVAAGIRANPGHHRASEDWHAGLRWQVGF